MSEHVRTLELGVKWQPSAPFAAMIAGDDGNAALALNAHHDDSDQRTVVLVWHGVMSVCMSAPNDEAINGHRLYRRGLADILWAGQVDGSRLVRSLEVQNRVHPSHNPAGYSLLQHHIVLTKERVVEVVAQAITVHRLDGTTFDAGIAALRQ